MFGELWRGTRLQYIMTPQEQEREFTRILRNGTIGKARFTDIRIVPDYGRWLFGKASKRGREGDDKANEEL
jgi:hypothetical protein